MEETHELTAKEIQSLILFLAGEQIRLDRIKGYLKVKKGKLTGE